jgi:hypothetical protein
MVIPLIEPIPIQDIFVSELHDVQEVRDGVFRFTFVTKQRSMVDQSEELVVSARILATTAAILFAAKWALKAIGMRVLCVFASR